LDSLADQAAIAGPILLAVMGAAVALLPPDPHGYGARWWIAAFVAVGITSAVAARRAQYVQQLKMACQQAKIEAILTGGDSYCYFEVIKDIEHRSEGPFQLSLAASTKGPVFKVNYWISPAGSRGTPAYYRIDYKTPLIPIVYPGPRNWDRALPRGHFLIEFDGQNGRWEESLDIVERNGLLQQEIRVTNERGELVHCEGGLIETLR
jgi:hypothetical protein